MNLLNSVCSCFFLNPLNQMGCLCKNMYSSVLIHDWLYTGDDVFISKKQTDIIMSDILWPYLGHTVATRQVTLTWLGEVAYS